MGMRDIHDHGGSSTKRRDLRPNVDKSGSRRDSDGRRRMQTDATRNRAAVDSTARAADAGDGRESLPPLTEQELWDAYRGVRDHDR